MQSPTISEMSFFFVSLMLVDGEVDFLGYFSIGLIPMDYWISGFVVEIISWLDAFVCWNRLV